MVVRSVAKLVKKYYEQLFTLAHPIIEQGLMPVSEIEEIFCTTIEDFKEAKSILEKINEGVRKNGIRRDASNDLLHLLRENCHEDLPITKKRYFVLLNKKLFLE